MNKEVIEMRKKQTYSIAIFILLISIIWYFRYSYINQQYSNFSNIEYKIFKTGEDVSFSSDFLASRECIDGYSIRVDAFEIHDYKQFIDQQNLTLEREGLLPGKIALVKITLKNDTSTADGIPLTDFKLHGIDSYALIDRTLLTSINPVLQGAYGIKLLPGSSLQIYLPFALFRKQYRYSTWNKLENYSFYLRVTAFPTVKDVCVQETN